MSEALMNPVVLAALVGAFAALAASLATATVTRKKDVGDTALRTLSLLVEKQEGDIAKLEGRVETQTKRLDAFDDEMENLHKKHRKLGEKYSTSLTYILALRTAWGGLKVRLEQAKFPHGDIPPIPEVIAVDMRHPAEPPPSDEDHD